MKAADRALFHGIDPANAHVGTATLRVQSGRSICCGVGVLDGTCQSCHRVQPKTPADMAKVLRAIQDAGSMTAWT